MRQGSDAQIQHWAVPRDDTGLVGTGPFYESDVLAAAQDLVQQVDEGTIINLSLGTILCRHGSLTAEEPDEHTDEEPDEQTDEERDELLPEQEYPCCPCSRWSC